MFADAETPYVSKLDLYSKKQVIKVIVKNGLVFGEKGCFEKRDLLIKNGRIADSIEDRSGGIDREIEESNGRMDREAEAEDGIGEVIDADGMYVIPGLVDIHIHGAMGHDFCDTEYTKLRKFLKKDGYLRIAPEVYMRIVQNRKASEKHYRRIYEFAPKTGVVRLLHLTEKQYSNIYMVTGEADSYLNDPPKMVYRSTNGMAVFNLLTKM